MTRTEFIARLTHRIDVLSGAMHALARERAQLIDLRARAAAGWPLAELLAACPATASQPGAAHAVEA
jgi:hypothetical protein